MASLSGKSGKCSNFGNCSLADARSMIEVPGGQDFVCTECNKPLLLTDSGPGPGNKKTLVVGALLVLLLLAAVSIGWPLIAGKKPASPGPEPEPPAVAKPAIPVPPTTGNCSEADERVGLCRRPAN
ncbi:MAG TPA: hypothetical protein PLS67_03430 [Accumulibacter sp.]|jgi:hypothetical protein|nr:hypothetical protein [Accumulibacter sp.]